jgi:hypothetical protein
MPGSSPRLLLLAIAAAVLCGTAMAQVSNLRQVRWANRPQAAIARAASFPRRTPSAPFATPQRFEGYTYSSNVMGYVNMSADYCDIKAAIAANNFTAALNVYANGKNARSGAGLRAFAVSNNPAKTARSRFNFAACRVAAKHAPASRTSRAGAPSPMIRTFLRSRSARAALLVSHLPHPCLSPRTAALRQLRLAGRRGSARLPGHGP